jgi:hypothetical protein
MRGGVFSLALASMHPHDISQVLDQHATCACAPGTTAPSRSCGPGRQRHRPGIFYLYNDRPTSTRWPMRSPRRESFFGF